MSYVDPGTFSSAAVLTAAQMNVIGDDIRYLKGKTDGVAFTGVSLLRSTNQSLANRTYTGISWSSAPVMQGGTWWTSGASITVPTGTVVSGSTYAILRCVYKIQFDINGANSRGGLVNLNGTLVEFGTYTSALPADNTNIGDEVWALAKDGDVITLQGWQSSGASLNVTQATLKVERTGFA